MATETETPTAVNPTQPGSSGIVGHLSSYSWDASSIGEDARILLQTYSGIPADEVDGHVARIRERAFQVHPYPCIGMMRFLDLSISKTDVYEEVVSRLNEGEKILDLGCCFGQEIRQLVFNGVPSENCYGSDLRADFIELGYDLFCDKATLKATFIPADIFDADSALNQLDGLISVVYTGLFFHLFDRPEQVAVAKRIVRLLNPKPGGLVIGRQVGNDVAGVYERTSLGGHKPRFRHNTESWKELWAEVGRETGTRWEVDVQLHGFGNWFGLSGKSPFLAGLEPNARRLKFVVRRL